MNLLEARSYPGTKPSSSVVSVDLLLSMVLLAVIIVLPAAVCYLYTGTTHSTGIAIASVQVLVALGMRMLRAKAFVVLILIILALTVHLGIALLLTAESEEWVRAILSMALFALIFLASYSLANWLFTLPAAVINTTLAILRVALIGVALAAIFQIQPSGALPWEKPTFPFTEPSHYALIFTPLLMCACVKSHGWQRIAWIATGYLLAYGLQSLSLVVGTTLAAIVTAPLWQLIIGALVAPTLLISIDLTYFMDRLDFTRQTNISTLVYIQGWELMFDSIGRSSGWGIGLQQLGYGAFRSPAAEMIFLTTRLELNLQDGGFMAAKLVSEFGIFGIALTGAFVVIAAKAALLLRKVAFNSALAIPGRDFALAIILGYSIDMFVRGVAYFAGSSSLVLAAIIFYLEHRPRIAADVTPAISPNR